MIQAERRTRAWPVVAAAGVAMLIVGAFERNNRPTIGAYTNYPPGSESSTLAGLPEIHLIPKYVRDIVDRALTHYEDTYTELTSLQKAFIAPSTSEQAIAEINDQAHKLILNGIDLGRIALPTALASTLEIAPDETSVNFLGRNFNLAAPSLEPHIFESILEISFKKQRTLIGGLDNIPNTLKQYDNEVDDLLWLKDKNLAITVNPDAYAILPTTHVLNLARTLRILEENDLPLPPKISYIRWDGRDAGGWYCSYRVRPTAPDRCENGEADWFSIVITNNSHEELIAHEVGHFEGNAFHLDPNNPKLYQLQDILFIGLMEAQIKNLGIENPEQLFVAHLPTWREQFADDFMQYILRGKVFRQRLARAYFEDPNLFSIVSTEYRWIGLFFGNREFLQFGRPQARDYHWNDLATVSDNFLSVPLNGQGYFLRPTIYDYPNYDGGPQIFGGNTVKILDGPKIGLEYFDDERSYWRVLVSSGEYSGNIGWVPAEILGSVYQYTGS